MTKLEFLSSLRERLTGLSSLSAEDLERSLEYYSESIDDRMEDGLTEEEAVEAMGSIDEIVAQILMGASMPKPNKPNKGKEKAKERSNHAWGPGVFVLLIFGFPLWFPLLIAVCSVAFSLYIALWSVIVALYAVDVAFVAGAVAGIFGSVARMVTGGVMSGLFALGAGLVCTGLAILWLFACVLITKGVIWFTKTFFLAIGSCFGGRKRKERA